MSLTRNFIETSSSWSPHPAVTVSPSALESQQSFVNGLANLFPLWAEGPEPAICAHLLQ
jgi:hypothetical protein